MDKTSDTTCKSNSCEDTFADSLDKLELDLDRTLNYYEDEDNEEEFAEMACAYTNHSGDMCGDCKFFSCINGDTRDCSIKMFEDIAVRIRNLKGDN